MTYRGRSEARRAHKAAIKQAEFKAAYQARRQQEPQLPTPRARPVLAHEIGATNESGLFDHERNVQRHRTWITKPPEHRSIVVPIYPGAMRAIEGWSSPRAEQVRFNAVRYCVDYESLGSVTTVCWHSWEPAGEAPKRRECSKALAMVGRLEMLAEYIGLRRTADPFARDFMSALGAVKEAAEEWLGEP